MYRDNTSNYLSMRQAQLFDTLRRLWIEHVMWTRSFIISTAVNLPDLKAVTDRLLRNPSDFADALRPLYGDQIARNFEEVLREHLLIAAALVNAAKAGDTRTAALQRTRWFENADRIASYLPSINPYWSRSIWQAMLYDHLKMTEDEATQILQGKYPESIAMYDSIELEALEMADEIGHGIIQQFGI